MAVAFPVTPFPNQVVTDPANNTAWRWDAPTTRWVPAATGAAFVPLTGGTMTGPLILGGPATDPNGAVTLGQLEPALQAGGRNVLHNPWFEINQRALVSVTANFQFPVDRWQLNIQGGDTVSTCGQTAIADAGRQAIGNEQAQFQLATIFTGTAGGAVYIVQRIEKVQRLAAKTVTLSFYALATTAGLRIGCGAAQSFGVGGSATVNQPGQSFALTTAWQRYQWTFTFGSIIGKTIGTGNDDFQSIQLWLSAGAANAAMSGNVGVQSGQIQIWGVQLEVGDEASPLEPTDPQQDLAKCQRFFFSSQRPRPMVSLGQGAMNNWIPVNVDLPVVMRIIPTVVLAFGGIGTSGYSMQVGNAAQGGFYVYANSLQPIGTLTSFNFTALAEL